MSETDTIDERPGIVTIDRDDPRFAELVGIVPDLDEEVAAPQTSISDRQFFQALASAPYNLITPQEALDAVKTGEIPAVIQAVIDGLPPERQFPTTMLLAGATTFERSNPLVNVFGASQGMDAAAIDAFWSFAGGL